MTHDPGGKSKPKWPADSIVKAGFSDCDRYRHWLMEQWVPVSETAMFLMTNPSVAGIDHADPTLIRTGAFARSWGYGGQLVGNMLDYRLTDLKTYTGSAADLVSPDNDYWLLRMAKAAGVVVLAYGMLPLPVRPRATQVISMLRDAGIKLSYLELCRDGTPRHPLYLRGDLNPQIYQG